jgi:hypothetical protein
MKTEAELEAMKREMLTASKALSAIARETGYWRDKQTAREYKRYMKALFLEGDRNMALQQCIGNEGSTVLKDGAL